MSANMGWSQLHIMYSKEQNSLYSDLRKGLIDNPLSAEGEKQSQEWIKLLSKLPLLLEHDMNGSQTKYAALSMSRNIKNEMVKINLIEYPDPIMILPNLYHMQMGEVTNGKVTHGQLIAFLLLYGETMLKYKNANITFSEEICNCILSRRLSISFNPESVAFLFNKP